MDWSTESRKPELSSNIDDILASLEHSAETKVAWTANLSSSSALALLSPYVDATSNRFPYPVVVVVLVWLLLVLIYLFCRWRQRAKNVYVIPRVFVLCSPRTVQYHYELILRVGMPSLDFNPDKHDIDITVYGHQKHEVVPMTRLNTRTLLDEPLVTSLSIVAYRLAEMPSLSNLTLHHSGPFKAWLYAYDFTVIDLSTNKETYYPLNQYIGSLVRQMSLEETGPTMGTQLPIDDVPLPQWSLEDTMLFLFAITNYIMLVMTLMPINCAYTHDTIAVLLSSAGAMSLVFFLDWLIYYHIRWNRDRCDYFNEYPASMNSILAKLLCFSCCVKGIYCDHLVKILIWLLAGLMGAACIYFSLSITDWRHSLVWLLANVNTCSLVLGIWNVLRQAQIGESLVALGLRFRGVDSLPVGMRYSELVADMRTKSGSNSEDGLSAISHASKLVRSFGPRSSVKSFGFDPIKGHPSRLAVSRLRTSSNVSFTGATPNNQARMS